MAPLWLGRDVADTVEFFKASGIGQTLLRDVDPATSTRVIAAVQAALEAHLTPREPQESADPRRWKALAAISAYVLFFGGVMLLRGRFSSACRQTATSTSGQ